MAVIAVGADAPAEEEESADESQHCHDHAGVPHCVGGGAAEEIDCGMPDRDYNVGLRIGMIFVILVTSGIGVFAPLILTKLPVGNTMLGNILMIVKQFGTGIIISTAFIHVCFVEDHLSTHDTNAATHSYTPTLSSTSTTSVSTGQSTMKAQPQPSSWPDCSFHS